MKKTVIKQSKCKLIFDKAKKNHIRVMEKMYFQKKKTHLTFSEKY